MATAPGIWPKRANNHKLDGPASEVVIQDAIILGSNRDYNENALGCQFHEEVTCNFPQLC